MRPQLSDKSLSLPSSSVLTQSECFTSRRYSGRFQYAQTVGLTKEPAFASQCIECGKCEQHCPQSIPIREKLKEADKALRPFPYKVGINAARWYMYRKGELSGKKKSALIIIITLILAIASGIVFSLVKRNSRLDTDCQ